MKEEIKQVFLKKLGLSRRAGVAIAGQDRVKSAMAVEKYPLLLLLTNDASSTFERGIRSASQRRKDSVIHLESVSRWELGAALGLASAQVVGLPLASRFAGMLLEDLRREGDVIE